MFPQVGDLFDKVVHTRRYSKSIRYQVHSVMLDRLEALLIDIKYPSRPLRSVKFVDLNTAPYNKVDKQEENAMKTEITVNTLDYPVKFENNKFKIGCQTVSYEDAQKVADFIKDQKKAELKLGRGDVLLHRFDDTEYLVAQISFNHYTLINMRVGTMYTQPKSMQALQKEIEEDNCFRRK